ncbi:hypothetical protein AV654_00455 [Paenibacillus elgii]|uniref:histidine kinase n=1 Tax=Paenibacillus elgii TaxID=189691 RepID=A0A164ARA7_9BACL|nr:ATP-binding protein [Paenibacillus elgii]KZE84412.1 hypothetical protein AV654_00455 [Paenibacillus elgii]
MFSKTRKRLTVYFTVLIMLFLITFNGIGYLLLSSYVYSTQEKTLRGQAEKYAEEQEHLLEKGKPKEKSKNKKEGHEKDGKNDLSAGALRTFFVVLDKGGRVVSGAIPEIEHPESFIQELTAWNPRQGDIRYFTVDNPKDERVDLIVTGRPLSEKGDYIGMLYTGADVSPQKAVLRQLMSILAGLSALFVVLSALLGYLMSGRAMKPIVEAFDRQRRFVSNASHELRTPLAIMHASLEVLESEEKSTMQPFSQQVLDDLKDETRRMSSLVSFLLTLAQGDSPANQLAMETFSLGDELTKLLRKIKPLAEEKELSLDLDISSDLPVLADKERLLQLTLILLDNAIQYTPKNGSVTLTAASEERTLTLAVADTGIGIAPELQEEIFERFYRVDSARGRGKGQLGLGLSIAKWIAEAHGGSIRVKSVPGQGSTFTVRLPVARPERG